MPQTCPQCQSEASDVANNCPNCGAQLRTAAGAPQGAAADATPPTPPPPPPPPPSAAPAGAGAAATTSAVPPYKFDAARWSLADRISGVATIILFISLFLSWFGISVIGVTVTASGVSAHGFLYLVMIIAILIVAYLVLRAGWDELPGGINLPHLITMMVATLIDLVLVFIAFIDKPGGSGVGWEFGAFVALIAAAAAAAPYAIPQLRAKTMS
ncbi:MAG TPA: zinc ribbon domain-containing protein [Acidimicrobiales bacterium]|nr:zinc ribbon domain-containing protein [Acidimicrobiales bacterium]